MTWRLSGNNRGRSTSGRTDADLLSFIRSLLVAGDNVTLTDVDNTIVISSERGGVTPTDNSPTALFHGLTAGNDPDLITLASLTEIDPGDPQTLATGAVTQGQYYVIFNPNTHPIQTIVDSPLGNNVYTVDSESNIFNVTEDAKSESGVTYDFLYIGPLNAGTSERFVVRY